MAERAQSAAVKVSLGGTKSSRWWGTPAALCRWNLGGGDLYSLIDLNGIAVDDLAAEMKCQFDSQSAFAGCGRPDDGNDWLVVSFCVGS